MIEKFAEDSELEDEIRLLGGIPLILALLRSATHMQCSHVHTHTRHTHTCTHTHAHTHKAPLSVAKNQLLNSYTSYTSTIFHEVN